MSSNVDDADFQWKSRWERSDSHGKVTPEPEVRGALWVMDDGSLVVDPLDDHYTGRLTPSEATQLAKRILGVSPSELGDMFVYPITIIADRYGGSYSHAKWTAWNCEPEDIPEAAQGGDPECFDFWHWHREPQPERIERATDPKTGLAPWEWTIGCGATPDEAESDLRKRLFAKEAR